jgi:hypothetical protein
MNLRLEVRQIRGFAEATHPRGLELRLDERWREQADRLEHDADDLPLPAYVRAFFGCSRSLGTATQEPRSVTTPPGRSRCGCG